MSTSSDRLVAGLVGDRYQITGLIASGGMGSVYRAHDTILQRTVALKVLKDNDAEFVARFRTEATNAARLSHPNIVQVFDFGYADDAPYMAMEYIEGQTLREVLVAKKVLRPDIAASIAGQIASALEHARRAGIVHRDVKPENILVATDGLVKVADFGLSRALAESRATQAGMLMGTAQYLAPEQVRDGFADHRSDIYSLGVVLYEMLTGRPAFGGDTPVVIAYKHVADDVPSPMAINPSVPRELDAVVARATARERTERFATAGEMAEALRGISRTDTGEIGGLVHHTIAIPLDGEHPTIALKRPGARAGTRRRSKQRRWIALVAALTVIGAVLAVTTFGSATVPSVVGQTQERAQALAEEAGVRTQVSLRNHPTVPSGTVISQEPSPGTELRRGGSMTLVVSLGPELAGLPDVRDVAFEDAEETLRAQGFTNIVRIDAFSAKVPRLDVISQEPASGLLVAKDTKITITVSKGPEFVKVPDVTGDPEATAKSDLTAAGLKVLIERRETLSAAAGEVIDQRPDPGARVEKGTEVTLVVAQSPPLKKVPNLRCKTRRQAADALAHDGFKVKFADSGNRVVDQIPGPGERAPESSTITVYMGFGSFC